MAESITREFTRLREVLLVDADPMAPCEAADGSSAAIAAAARIRITPGARRPGCFAAPSLTVQRRVRPPGRG